jgi:hypothetical protein
MICKKYNHKNIPTLDVCKPEFIGIMEIINVELDLVFITYLQFWLLNESVPEITNYIVG